MVLICVFLIRNVEHHFHVPVGHLYVFFGKSVQVLCPFLNQFVCLLLSCMGCLYVFGISSLPVLSLANTFSHSVGYPFILLIVSFAAQKLVSLIKSHLFIFGFVSFAKGDRSKKKYCYDLC